MIPARAHCNGSAKGPRHGIRKVDAQGIITVDHTSCSAYGPGCDEVCVAVCPTDILHMPGMLPDADKKKKQKAAKAAKEADAHTGTAG